MAVPDFQTMMLPVLQQYAGGADRSTRDVRDSVAGALGVTAADRAEVLPSGRQTRYANRVAWSHIYLKQAGLLASPRRGVYQITERGRALLASPPDRISIAYLTRYPEFVAFQTKQKSYGGDSDEDSDERKTSDGQVVAADAPLLTPDEQMRTGYKRLREALADQLLDRVRQATPAFFESLVVDILVAMGYGGTHDDAARVVGRSGDGGIDGIIKEDRLGLENIYVQAKRYTEGTIGRPAIQQFAGALQGQRARKGVFITTSTFTRDAIEYAKGLQNTIVLVDGPQLAELMIDYGVAVSEVQTLRIMKLDEDWFAEE